MSELDRIKSRIKNLSQNKGKSEEELNRLAKEQFDKQSIVDSLAFCINDEEKKYATNLLDKYLAEKEFSDFAERTTLGMLIDTQILIERCKSMIKTQYNTANPSLPITLTEEYRELCDKANELQKSLGLIKKDEKQQSWEIFWNELKQKALNYAKTHAGEFIHKCPHCGKMFRYLLRMTEYESQKIPYFKDTKVYNQTVFQLFHEKRITEKEAADILGVSPMYIEMFYKELFLRQKQENENKE